MPSTDIGLISDTHGLLRPEAIGALLGCEHIVHAGDVGGPDIVDGLRRIAPVTVVRGNNDPADAWPERESLRLPGLHLIVLHEVGRLGAAPAGVDVVVYGHSHRPAIEWKAGVLFVNPGSAGPRRFTLPVTAARLTLRRGAAPQVQLLHLLPTR